MDIQHDLNVKHEIRVLKTDFHQELDRDIPDDIKSPQLIANLAIMGELTDSGKKAFDSIVERYSEKNVLVRLIDWQAIFNKVNISDDIPNFKIELKIDDDRDILKKNDYCYLIGYAYDFYTCFRQHGWILFDLNVRYQIPNSPINKKIVNTLSLSRARKNFHHLNNGLLIVCDNYTIDKKSYLIKVKNPQIINGCQTVRSICEAYETLSPEKQKEFRNDTRIQIKIIQHVEKGFIDELVITTNDQNPMNQRNLKSNTSEQRELQKRFNQLPDKWFYQRKDGEFKSLSSSVIRQKGFRKSDYQVAPRVFRIIDNQDLAKYWYPHSTSINQKTDKTHLFNLKT